MRRCRFPARRRLIGVLALSLVTAGCAESTPRPTDAAAVPSHPAPAPAPAVAPTASPTPTAPRPGASDPAAPTPVVEHGPRTARRVALTFDADMTTGMKARLAAGREDSYYNADLIATLRRLEVPATLFLTGLWVQQYPDVTRELARDDLFELGTHSWSHRAFTAGCYGLGVVPREEMLAEVTDAVDALDALDPGATRWFRFPGGCHDAAALRLTGPAGVTAVGTDVAGGDGGAPSARAIADTVLGAVRPGSIVTLHMHGGEVVPLTDEAVGIIVPALRKSGYSLVTVTDLLADGR